MTFSIIAMLTGASIALPRENAEDTVYIPAGEFIMGTDSEEVQQLTTEYNIHPSFFASETPQRRVYVKAFHIDRYPVTNAQYQEFINATGHRPPSHWNGTEFPSGQDDYPVTHVNWNAANAYAQWTGKRLPTEEEWEKAARGIDGRRYPWGNEWDEEACWIDDLTSPQTPSPQPVGCCLKGASPYGVMEMAGNVAEWCSTPSQPPNTKLGWAWYVVKGAGNAHHLRFNFRCAARNFSAHASRQHSWLGFRCALDAPEIPAFIEPPPPPPLRPLPTARPAAAPDASLYGKQPITISVSQGGHGAALHVPHFPAATFGLNIPEQVGVESFPFGWAANHTPIRWDINEGGSHATYRCTFEEKATLTVALKAGFDHVDFTIAIRNLTDQPFTQASSNTCLNNHNAPYFENPERDHTLVWTDDGPVSLLKMPIGSSGEPLHGGWAVAAPDQAASKSEGLVRYPFIAVLSRDRKWIVAQAYGAGITVANNAHYTCLHSRPHWPDIPPGEERELLGKFYFLQGSPADLLTRWQRDFHDEL